jgi:sugar O-acyltransferase (sialic acid O-acetyltransferase NeuD family)
MTKLFAVYGASGFGKEVMPVLREQLTRENNTTNSLYFIDDNSEHADVSGVPVCNYQQFYNMDAQEKYVTIAIANSQVRQKLTEKCVQDNISIVSVKASNVVIMDDVAISDGVILSPFVTLTSNIQIGLSFQANIYSYIGHDCIIGDYVTFAPAVKCNGNVIVKDHAYIGTGAIIKQGTPDKPLVIGAGAVVAAGAFVNKDIPDGMTVFGSPAIELTRENLQRRNG